MGNRLVYLEASGIILIFLLGSAWHFLYDWSGSNALVGLVAPVNESVWEHFKIGVYPALLFALLGYAWIGKYYKRYWSIRALQLYLIPVFIALLFYAYTAILGYHLLVLDIATFAVAIVLVQLIGYRLLIKPTDNYRSTLVGIAAILALLFVLAWFTINPLPYPIFIE